MTSAELRAKWMARRLEWRTFRATVDGEAVASEILADLDTLAKDSEGASVTLREAKMIGGYSVDHLQRLIATGQIENLGRKYRPRIRRRDVPIKPGRGLRDSAETVSSERRRIVASVATSGNEEHS